MNTTGVCAVLPTYGVTTYPVTTEPPELDGATHDTVTDPFPRTTPTPDGTPGTVAGVTEPDDTDSTPDPTSFVADTLNVYAVPFTNPVTTHDNAPDVVHDRAPGLDTTEYPVITEPLLDGADHATDALAFPGVATTPDGAPGTVRGVTATATDAAPTPAAFTARTRTLYAVPFTNPVIANGLAVEAGLRATHVDPPFNEYS